MKITIKEYPESNWIYGVIDGVKFRAKVYSIGSKFGINKGRVRELYIFDEDGEQVFLFESGFSSCDVEQSKIQPYINEIVKFFDNKK